MQRVWRSAARTRAGASFETPPHPQERRGWKRKRRPGCCCGVRLRATNSALFSCFPASPLFSLAESADGCELGGKRRELGFYGGDFLLVGGVAPRVLGGFQRLGRLGFIEVVAADRGVGEHGHPLGLHFENSSPDGHQLLLPAAGRLDP